MALVLYPRLPNDLQELRPEHHQEAAALNDQQLPNPWVQIVHPEGDIYFYDPQNRVFTWADPRDPDNAATLENAIQQLRHQLTPAHLPNEVIGVIAFTNAMRQENIVDYYLVHNGLREIGWIESSPQALGLRSDLDEDRFQSWLSPQYWDHICFYPSGAPVDVVAEQDLIGRLIAGLLPVNHAMTPFSPEECRNHLSLIELNRDTQPDERRMADIGRLLALIYTHLHFRRYGREQRRRRDGFPVHFVERRIGIQNEDRQRWLGIFAGMDISILISSVYYILLAETNKHLGYTWSFMGILLLAGIAATLLLRSISPLLYLHMEFFATGYRPNEPLAKVVLTCLLVSNALSYGLLLNGAIQYLSSLEHTSFMPRLIMIIFVLAAAPVVYVPRLNDPLAHDHLE